MPYYYLAMSLNEFGTLTTLVDRLLDRSDPMTELMDRNYLPAEIHRIKQAGLRDIHLFHIHYPHYIRVQLSTLYNLMIRVHEIRMALPGALLQVAMVEGQLQCCNVLLAGLLELESFYVNLGREIEARL